MIKYKILRSTYGENSYSEYLDGLDQDSFQKAVEVMELLEVIQQDKDFYFSIEAQECE